MPIAALTSNFYAMTAVLWAAFYADYALTILGQKLYVEHARQYQVHDAYELNPQWREIVGQSRYWHPKIITVGAIIALLAAALWYVHEQPMGEIAVIPASYLRAFTEGAFCVALSRWLVVIGMHLRNIYTFSHLMKPGLICGQITMSAEFTYGSSVCLYLVTALAFTMLALLAPSSATVGFAIGSLLLARQIRQMYGQHKKLNAAASEGEE